MHFKAAPGPARREPFEQQSCESLRSCSEPDASSSPPLPPGTPWDTPAAMSPMVRRCRRPDLCCLEPFLSLQFSHRWTLTQLFFPKERRLPSTRRSGGASLCSGMAAADAAYQKLCGFPAEKNKNPMKTAKLLWSLWLHKGTAHFSGQISASNIKECFCQQRSSSRNQNWGLQLASAQLQKHLECSTCWIPTQRKRIPQLNVFPSRSRIPLRTAKEQATNEGPQDAHKKIHGFGHHPLSSTSYWWHLHLNGTVQRHPTDKGVNVQ